AAVATGIRDRPVPVGRPAAVRRPPVLLGDEADLDQPVDVESHGVLMDTACSGEIGHAHAAGGAGDQLEDAPARRNRQRMALTVLAHRECCGGTRHGQWLIVPATSPAWKMPTAPLPTLANLWVTMEYWPASSRVNSTKPPWAGCRS